MVLGSSMCHSDLYFPTGNRTLGYQRGPRWVIRSRQTHSLSSNRSHRHLLNPRCCRPADACYPNHHGSRCYHALGGKQASHISLLLITFTSSILPFPTAHKHTVSLSHFSVTYLSLIMGPTCLVLWDAGTQVSLWVASTCLNGNAKQAVGIFPPVQGLHTDAFFNRYLSMLPTSFSRTSAD